MWAYYVNPALAGISVIEVPVAATVTTYHETVDFGYIGAYSLLNGTHDVKIDFADFAFDGTSAGCSGHTAALPICVRMWLDDARYMAWVFDTYPVVDDPATAENEATAGTGRFKIYNPGSGGDDFAVDARINYDFQDPTDVLSELFAMALMGESKAMGGHVRTTQQGDPSVALKQIGYSIAIDETPGEGLPEMVSRGDYLAQFRQGYDYWSGSIDGQVETGSGNLSELTNQCAVISTAAGTAEASCMNVGGIDIRVGGLPFLAPVQYSDVEFIDFPVTPTF